MDFNSIDLAGPLNEMAIKFATFSILIAITYLIPFIFIEKLFKSIRVAKFVSGLVLISYLYFTYKNGIFFDWFLSFIYLS